MKSADILRNYKDPTPPTERIGIYEIKCAECPTSYIGQTKRNFKHRLKEHQTASGFDPKSNSYTKRLKPELSCVAAHKADTAHKVNWETAKIIKPCPIFLLNAYEQLEIFKHPFNSNKQEDDRFPDVWKPLFSIKTH